MAYIFSCPIRMKKIILIGAGFLALNVSAQNPSQRTDSLFNPNRTDSAAFRDPGTKQDTSLPNTKDNTYRRDSLPMDDRKPKNPPKK
jgi:hypothetical protein